VVQCGAVWRSVVQCGAVWCSVVQCGAVWCSVLKCGEVWCSVVQCAAVWFSVLRYVAVCNKRVSYLGCHPAHIGYSLQDLMVNECVIESRPIVYLVIFPFYVFCVKRVFFLFVCVIKSHPVSLHHTVMYVYIYTPTLCGERLCMRERVFVCVCRYISVCACVLYTYIYGEIESERAREREREREMSIYV